MLLTFTLLTNQYRGQTLSKGRKVLARRLLRSCLTHWFQESWESAHRQSSPRDGTLPHDLSTIAFEGSIVHEHGEMEVDVWGTENLGNDSTAGEDDHHTVRQALEVEYIYLHDRLEQQSRTVVTRMFREQLAAALDAFGMAILQQKRQRIVGERAIRRLQVALLARSWDGLVMGVARLKNQRAVIGKVMSRMACLQLACSFGSLWINLETSKERRRQLQKVIHRWQHSALFLAFNTWWEQVTQRRPGADSRAAVLAHIHVWH